MDPLVSSREEAGVQIPSPPPFQLYTASCLGGYPHRHKASWWLCATTIALGLLPPKVPYICEGNLPDLRRRKGEEGDRSCSQASPALPVRLPMAPLPPGKSSCFLLFPSLNSEVSLRIQQPASQLGRISNKYSGCLGKCSLCASSI